MGYFYTIEFNSFRCSKLILHSWPCDHENNCQSQCSKIHRFTSCAFSCNHLQWGTHNTTVAPLPCIAEETKIWSTTKKKAWEINNHMLRHSCEWCRRHCRTSGASLRIDSYGFHFSILRHSLDLKFLLLNHIPLKICGFIRFHNFMGSAELMETSGKRLLSIVQRSRSLCLWTPKAHCFAIFEICSKKKFFSNPKLYWRFFPKLCFV